MNRRDEPGKGDVYLSRASAEGREQNERGADHFTEAMRGSREESHRKESARTTAQNGSWAIRWLHVLEGTRRSATTSWLKKTAEEFRVWRG